MDKSEIDTYWKLNREFMKKQLLERIVFELEFNFLITSNYQLDIQCLINDVRDGNNWNLEEFDNVILEAIKLFEEKHKIKLQKNGGFLGVCNDL